MRPIPLRHILTFITLCLLTGGFDLVLTRYIFQSLPPTGFRELACTLLFVGILYAAEIAIYRAFLSFFPFPQGYIQAGTRQEFIYQICLLFYLIFFNSLINNRVIPAPLMRIIYLLLGANLGRNTYCSGVILDPPLIRVGHDTLLGQDCLLYAHAIEGQDIAHYPITIGSNVTVGARAIIMPGVSIEDGAIVAAGAVVKKGCQIKANEIWGGVPAKKIKMACGITDAIF